MCSERTCFGLRFLLVFVFCTASVTGGSRRGSLLPSTQCPTYCHCQGLSADCAGRRGQPGLTAVPTDLPANVERLNLQSNNIRRITRQSFQGLRRLRILQLMDNDITEIEPGAFDELISLERLRLNRNKLKEVPANLFAKNSRLYRLDLSHNKLTFIGRATLQGAPRLKNLQLDNNKITCITESAIANLRQMEILTLNRNHISTIPKDAFGQMRRLRIVRLSDNNLVCDCHLEWLAKWLRSHTSLGMYTRCGQPPILRGTDLTELRSEDFQCSSDHATMYPSKCQLAEDKVCPDKCYCQEGIVRCDGRKLKEIPLNIPLNVQQLHLERNKIKMVPSKVFQNFKQLRRIYLQENMISYIAPDAFYGLQNLYSLILRKNLITELPRGLFKGMLSLQVLLLNENKISCVPQNTFDDLGNLGILSLYDNKIKAITNGTFSPLRNLRQLHLAQNPFICDCNLRWLSTFLHQRHHLKSNYARCESPKRMKRKRIGVVKDKKFRCRGSEAERTKNSGTCEIYSECPTKCSCVASKIDCSGQRLVKIPDELPLYVTHLRLANNEIKSVKVDSILRKLKHLKSLDLSNNRIENVEDAAFSSLKDLEELNLSKNRLTGIDRGTLQGLKKLKVLLIRANRIRCINNDTFTDTQDLTLLSLYENSISCVMSDSFERLTKLRSLNLQLNPLVCNCHMSWMPAYLRRNVGNLKDVGNPICGSPALLMNTPVVSLHAKYFKCAKDFKLGCHNGIPPCCTKDAISCDPRAYCPPKCTCEGTTVKCDRQSLTDVPGDVPTDTSHLFLRGNDIRHINASRLARLPNLRVLDLSSNKLRGLKAYAFANLTKLRTLILSFNKLACIDSKSFAGLSELRALILQSNDISSIPYGSFDDLQKINNIGVGQNPFYCDCNIKWINDFFRNKFIDNGIALCAGPTNMAHKSIYHSKPDDFHCPQIPSDDMHRQVVAKCNICSKRPCKHGGLCKAQSFDKFTCTCQPGFYGLLCDRRIDACFGSPCDNGATCKPVDVYGRYQCLCPRGFTGHRCHINADDCRDNECKNNATCIDGIDNYQCKCRPGYSGNFCQNKINYCVEYNPCKNSAQCLVLPDGGYQCRCRVGWEGRNCGININDCLNVRCENGGKCVDEVNAYTCKCRPGYYGKKCEFVNLPGLQQSTSVCMHHECLNGGRCVQQKSNKDYKCHCVPGYEGKKCEKLTTVGFYADSYYKIPQINVYPSGTINMLLATRQKQGIILYLGEGHNFFLMSLYMGLIRMSYSVGLPPGAIGYSLKRIDDGKFHNVSVKFNGKDVTLKVDGTITRTRAEYDSTVTAAPTINRRDPIYLGALPLNKVREARQNVNIRETFSFGGCIKAAYLNGRQMDFKQNFGATRYKLVDGCPTFLKPPNPCVGSIQPLCKNRGVCKPRQGTPKGYTCKCRKNYTGRTCEIKACKRLVTHQYYKDKATGCRSRRRLKIRRCRGTCPARGGFCCKPKRFKIRYVKFHCPYGLVTRRVKMIRRCGCKPCGNHNQNYSRSHRARSRARARARRRRLRLRRRKMLMVHRTQLKRS